MIGFDSIGSSSIGQLNSDSADAIVTVPSSSDVTVTVGAAPVISGGAMNAPPSKSVAVTVVAPVVGGGAKIDVPAAFVTVTRAVPTIIAVQSVLTPPKTVTVTVVVPKVLTGSLVKTPPKTVTVTLVPPLISAGVKIDVPSTSVAVTSSRPVIGTGNAIDASNTVIMITPYGEIGTSSIGSGAIGEADEISTRLAKLPPIVVISVTPPKILAGTIVKPPSCNVVISSSPAEIHGRIRKLRILAIAS